MQIQVRHLRQILNLLSKKTGLPLEYSSFDRMAEKMEEKIPGKYLYEKLFRKAEHAKSVNEEINLQDNKLNVIAMYLGYDGIHDLLKKVDVAKHPVLDGLLGNYLCYVRRNSKDTVIFCSPVKIEHKDGEYLFELQGPQWRYSGTVTLSNGCLFILMNAPSGKQLHHVYKIGLREKPKLLKGIFSGVSTTFEPIGGRVVLVAYPVAFEELKGRDMTVEDLQKSGRLGERLAQYFERYEENNLNVKEVVTFTEDDL